MNEINYSSAELMIINAARLLRDGDVVFVGVGHAFGGGRAGSACHYYINGLSRYRLLQPAED